VMPGYKETVECLLRSRVIAVIRSRDSATARELARAYIEGGLKAIELTTSIPGWEAVLAEVLRFEGDKACIGLGTVTTVDETYKAVGLGAKFIVSPVLIPDVVTSADVLAVPVIPGALTPTEIYQAVAAGADMVKVFPVSSVGGPAYIKALLAPMPYLKLIPTGGVAPANAVEYLRAGAVAVGMGGNLAPREALEKKDWHAISHSVADFLANIRLALGEGDR